MNNPPQASITEIDACEIPERFSSRSHWAEIIEKALRLASGKALVIEGTPMDSVHAIRNQIKRRELPLAITSRQKTIYISRLPQARRPA
jgi:replicative DNA helicase